MPTRREVLIQTLQFCAATLSVPILGGCTSSAPNNADPTGREIGSGDIFNHGIATGDPLPNQVIFWTRITPRVAGIVTVQLTIATDPSLNNIVRSVQTTTHAGRDYTVNIDVTGLNPATTYYYQFSALGRNSHIGRTRTAPATLAAVTRLRIGVAVCTSYAHGHFNALQHLAQRADLDVVFHLGDYIYEYANGVYGDLRTYQPPHEIITLEDYRTRHAHYKQDPDLQALHRQHATVHTWDDHDFANNSYTNGAENHTNIVEGMWSDRLNAGLQAFLEWLPIRHPLVTDTTNGAVVPRIFRNYRYGELCEFIFLDTRLTARDEPDTNPADYNAAGRTLLGATQKQWLRDTLQNSTAHWKCVVSGVMFGQYKAVGTPNAINNGGVYPYGDQWDGYQAERSELFTYLANQNNTVVMSGDLHGSLALDLTPDPNNPLTYDTVTGMGSVSVEWVCNSATSPGDLDTVGPDGTANASENAVRSQNPHMKYFDQDLRGYTLFDITTAHFQGEFWYVNTITTRQLGEYFGTAWACLDGTSHLEAATQTLPRANPPVLAT